MKRVFILIIFAAVISAASAFGSPIAKEKTYADEVATVELASDKTGIKDELEDKSLKQILADVSASNKLVLINIEDEKGNKIRAEK